MANLRHLQLFNLFPSKLLKMSQNGQFCPILNFSYLFSLKRLRMIQNSQFYKKNENTMIQGNFYERLHFARNSCAISPMASLFSIAFMFIPIYLKLEGNVPPPPEMKKLILGQGDILVLADVHPPAQKLKLD